MAAVAAPEPPGLPSTARVTPFQHDFLATLAGGCADGVYAVDAEQRIVFWSRTAEKLTGSAACEVIGRPCFDVMLGGDYDGHPFCRRDCPTIVSARRGRSIPSYDLQARTSEGHSVWFNMTVLPLTGRSSRQTLVVHIFRDVTARRRAELLALETLAAASRFSEAQGATPAIARPDPAPLPDLSPRELEVLHLLSGGLRTQEMAKRLGIAQATVRNHVDRVLGKLGVHSRLEAVVYATQLGLL